MFTRATWWWSGKQFRAWRIISEVFTKGANTDTVALTWAMSS